MTYTVSSGTLNPTQLNSRIRDIDQIYDITITTYYSLSFKTMEL